MPPPTLEYQSSPTPWQRWLLRLLGAGSAVLSHVAAIGVSVLVFFILPLLLFVLTFIVLIIVSLFTKSEDMGGLLFLPIGLFMIAFGGVFVVLTVCVVGILTDISRRALRGPIWTLPPAIYLLGFFGTLLWAVREGSGFQAAFWWAGGLSLVMVAIYGVYWLPLLFGDWLGKWLRRGVQRLLERQRQQS